MRDLIEIIKYWCQRHTRGYSDEDLRKPNRFIIKKFRPIIEEFTRQESVGEHGKFLPVKFSTDPAQWLDILQKIDFAFNGEVDANTPEKLEEGKQKIQEGFELFGKYLQDLFYF